MRAGDPAIVGFLESLRKEGLEKDAELGLPDGVDFGGQEGLGHLHGRLLVRDCYRDLTELVFEMAGVGDYEDKRRCHQRHFAIQGNPGIGKSLFSYYLLYRLMQMNKTIVWQPSGADRRIVITTESIEFVDRSQCFIRELDDNATWYIVDAAYPAIVNANTVLVCSPQRELIEEFENAGAELLYMPVWSRQEIELAHQLGLACSSNDGEQVSLEGVRERFRLWGGIPRYVFEWSRDKKLLNSDVAVVNFDVIVRMTGEVRYADATSLNLVHITVGAVTGPERYRSFKLFFASSYVEEKLVMERKADLLKCLDVTEQLAAGVSFRGQVCRS